MKVVTITDLDFKEARLWSEPDPGGGVKLFVSVGFEYVNANGVMLRGQRTVELSGARKTTVATFFTNLKSDLLTLEAIA